MLKVAQLLLLQWLVSEACQVFMSAWVVYKWLHLYWTSRQPAVIHYKLADEFDHAFSCLCDMWSEIENGTCFQCGCIVSLLLPNHLLHFYGSACGINYASKNYISKMVENSEQLLYRLWVAICRIAANCMQASIFLPWNTILQIIKTGVSNYW